MRFWNGMTRKLTPLANDKILIGDNSTEEPLYANVEDLPFATQQDVDDIVGLSLALGTDPTSDRVIRTLKKKLNNVGYTVSVGKIGCDYTTINAALYNIIDNIDNPITILLYPGTYIESVNLCGRYISIVGVNKETCIIKTFTNDYWNPPIDMACNNNLFNLTIIADDDGVTTPTLGVGNMPAYGIHFDISSRYENQGIKVQGRATVQNCRIISKHQHAVALGLWTNQYLEFINCEMYSPATSAFRAHNYYPAGGTNQKLLLRDCQIWNEGSFSPCVLQDPNNNNGGHDNTDTVFTFIRNVFYSVNGGQPSTYDYFPARITGAVAGKIMLGVGSFGNSINELNK